MTSDIDLRTAAREIFNVALASVDARRAVQSAVRLDGPRLKILETMIDLERTKQEVYVLAIGKAAYPMAVALDETLGNRIKSGYVVGTQLQDYVNKLIYPPGKFVTPWGVGVDAHPLPTNASLRAAQAAFEFLQHADADRALVIFLISGGGSSMIEWPIDEQITLADLRVANRALISCGASITEINAVRRAVSSVKGGRLAASAPNTDQVTLVISDTAKGQESIVASGLTFDPPVDAPDASEVIARYGLTDKIPPSIMRILKRPAETTSGVIDNRMREHYVLLDCDTAISAATNEAKRLGFLAEHLDDISEQPIDEGCRLILSQLRELRSRTSAETQVACLISGGEFSCPVRGTGIGGRNAETALRCAIDIDVMRRQNSSNTDVARLAVLSAGTDGIDGNSPAAGALATGDTVERGRIVGLNAAEFLERSDAFSFFDSLDDAIVTGPTGTNVRDIRIALLECADSSALFSS